MTGKVKLALNIIILIPAAANCVLNFFGGNHGLSVIWGIVAVLNTVVVILDIKQRK